MGFFDKIRNGSLFFGKKTPTIVMQFNIKDKEYILEEFDLDFKQDLDHRGNPDSLVYGGTIILTISDIPDNNINWWMMDPYTKQDGEFRFLMNDGAIKEGALLQIQFKDAYCINYQKSKNPQGAGFLTTLTISPRYLRIGNEEFENNQR